MKIFLDALSRSPIVSIGTQALILGSMYIIKRYISDVKFVFLSKFPEIEKHFLQEKGFNVDIRKRADSRYKTIFNIREIVREVDAIVSAWGDGYISSEPQSLILKTFFLQSNDKPVILFPSSIGPFKYGWRTIVAKRGLLFFDHCIARDTITYDYFQTMGLPNISLLPDTAFVLKPVSAKRKEEIFVKEDIPKDIKYIGLNISQLLNVYYKELSVNIDYIDLMIELIIKLNDISKLPVILIPHQIFPPNYKYNRSVSSVGGDDRYAIRQILEKIPNSCNIYALLGQYSCYEYKRIIADSEIFIGGRMHSVIGAISEGVPAALIQYSHKAPGVMKTVGLEKYVWPFDGDKSDFFNIIEKLWRDRTMIKDSLKLKIDKVKEDAWLSGAILIKYLQKYGKLKRNG